MKMSRPASSGPTGSIWLSAETVWTPGIALLERVRTRVVRLGRGFPIDSKVFRPITMTCPVVIFLNHLKSSGRCQGMVLRKPMTRLRDIAAIALKGFIARPVRDVARVLQDLPGRPKPELSSGKLRKIQPTPTRYNGQGA